MKSRFLKTLLSSILGVSLVLGFSSNVQALETQKDINENPFLAGKTIDTNEFKVDHKLIHKLPTSLGIEKANIDIESLHDTNPLTSSDKSMLLLKGYDRVKIKSMDRGDFLILKDTWNLSPEVIKAAKVIYPELDKIDLSSWTYGQYYKYSKNKDDEKYSPVPEQIKQFRERGITLADARYMLKDFNNYQAILNLSDDEIKDYLLSYYELKETYAKTLKAIEQKSKDSNNEASFTISATSKIIDGATYYYCYVPGYGYDWFHETSQTHVGINSDMYGADAQQIFEAIYPSGGSYYATNMWGTYSLFHTGAHEGIDFNGTPEGQNLMAVVDGSLGQRDSTWGQVAISSTETTHAVNYRIFYMHMANISPYSTINSGQTIGKESNVNTDGIHLHLQVYHNQSQTYCHTSDDNILSSDSPYSIFYSWV